MMRILNVCVLLGFLGLVACEYTTEFMTSLCNADLGTRTSGRFETSQSLTYENKMNCYSTIRVAEGKRVMLHFNRFDVEPAEKGVCTDYLNIYDGGSTSAPALTPAPLCDSHPAYFNVSSTANAITLHFVSDTNAVFRGFEVVFTEFTYGSCDGAQFSCNNSLCIDSSGDCNGLNECGDGSDEDDHCTEQYIDELDDAGFPWGLLIGCLIAVLVLILIAAVVAYRVYDYYYWKRWLERNHFSSDIRKQRVLMYEYPVTDRYNQYELHGKYGRRKPDVDPLFLGSVKGGEAGGGVKFIDEY